MYLAKPEFSTVRGNLDADDEDAHLTKAERKIFGKGYDDGERFGRYQERTAIVEYIRSVGLTSGVHQTGAWLATAIEAGAQSLII